MNFKTIIIGIHLILFIGCKQAQTPCVTLIDAATFKTHTATQDKQLLDIRTPAEYHSFHLEGATLANLYQYDLFIEKISTLDQNQPVYIYCRSGNRTQIAAQILCEKGFKVYDLKGGIITWQ